MARIKILLLLCAVGKYPDCKYCLPISSVQVSMKVFFLHILSSFFFPTNLRMHTQRSLHIAQEYTYKHSQTYLVGCRNIHTYLHTTLMCLSNVFFPPIQVCSIRKQDCISHRNMHTNTHSHTQNIFPVNKLWYKTWQGPVVLWPRGWPQSGTQVAVMPWLTSGWNHWHRLLSCNLYQIMIQNLTRACSNMATWLTSEWNTGCCHAMADLRVEPLA
jgi:hypothetical protein